MTLMGHQPFSELDRLRRGAMVNVICSRYETICRVLMETMAVGCPFVAARAGGIPEAFRDDIDGLSHRPEDSDDLASKIITLLNNPARAAELGRQAAATCEERFHPDVIAERMVQFLPSGHRQGEKPLSISVTGSEESLGYFHRDAPAIPPVARATCCRIRTVLQGE